jgi:uncharacterized lipoprotein NlpE involved in copper resistance
MKKIILTLTVIALTLMSCNKECTSTCGTIVSDGIDTPTNCYWLDIQNDCSGNTKRFCFDQNTWMNNYVGDPMCLNNQASW